VSVNRFKFAAALVVSITLVAAVGVLAATDPYPTGLTGYDISYPQCGGPMPAGSFSIIGVNGGRPFTNNRCLGAEYAAAPKSTAPSLYINTGYAGAYRTNITAGCSALSRSVSGSSKQVQAWAIGCSEADSSMSYATAQGATSPAVWWLDVETANSWSSSNLSMNRYAIQGAVSRLARSGLPVGIYSSASMWSAVTGAKYTPTNVAADWEAAGGSCSAPFTSSPVWLVQSTVSGFDSDFAC
jgi:hypothetical protein